MTLEQEYKSIKDDIKHLDSKMDKLEENTNKRLEKIEENMNKFTETIGGAICRLTESMNDLKLAMVKNYIEKDEVEKIEVELIEKINDVNKHRKQDIKEIKDEIECMDKNGSVSFNEILKYMLFIGLSSGVTYLLVK